MTLLLLLVVLVVAPGAETVRRAWSDGAGPDGPPRSHPEDPRFRSPAAR